MEDKSYHCPPYSGTSKYDLAIMEGIPIREFFLILSFNDVCKI